MNTDNGRREQLTLELLNAVDRDHNISQRSLAEEMGIALGLTNSYLKRCVRKGWIKISTAPANRYLYYLTPTGFAEKSRLTARYLSNSLSFYREAGESCLRTFHACNEAGYRKVLLAGDSDLAEIAAIRALEAGIEVEGVYDPNPGRKRCAGRPLLPSYIEAPGHDAIVLTDLSDPRGMLEHVKSIAEGLPIFSPDILRIG
jgi:DNA-binding MarR family transcriptional regulator